MVAFRSVRGRCRSGIGYSYDGFTSWCGGGCKCDIGNVRYSSLNFGGCSSSLSSNVGSQYYSHKLEASPIHRVALTWAYPRGVQSLFSLEGELSLECQGWSSLHLHVFSFAGFAHSEAAKSLRRLSVPWVSVASESSCALWPRSPGVYAIPVVL